MNRYISTLLLAAIVISGAARAHHDPPPLPDPIPVSIPTGPFTLEFTDIASTLVFPTFVAAIPDYSGRLLVAERGGIVRLIKNGVVEATPFLDISATFISIGGSALASIAFHPEFAVPGSLGEGLLYTVYQEPPGTGSADFGSINTVKHQSVVYEWQVSASDPNIVEPASRREVLRIDEGSTAHNANDLEFGPDGYLYIAKGDDDMGTNITRDGTNIHGAILRIDVDDTGGSGRYGIPPNNPFIAPGDARLDELYAYGFRNPWRLGFHPVTGKLLVADIGENDIEEINIVESGNYYGWIDKEGSFAFLGFNKGVTDDLTDLPPGFNGVDPVAEYDHTEGDRSITGGIVYNGTLVPEMIGHYVFGDYVSGRLMHLDPVTGTIQEISIDPGSTPLTPGIIGIGEDTAGELLLVITEQNLNPTGRVLSLVGGTSVDGDADGDSILNAMDNCIRVVNPDQRDTDGDGFGNICDPDFDNNGVVQAADLAYLKSEFFTADPDADLNGDGGVNAADLAILKTMFFGPPGPSGLAP